MKLWLTPFGWPSSSPPPHDPARAYRLHFSPRMYTVGIMRRSCGRNARVPRSSLPPVASLGTILLHLQSRGGSLAAPPVDLIGEEPGPSARQHFLLVLEFDLALALAVEDVRVTSATGVAAAPAAPAAAVDANHRRVHVIRPPSPPRHLDGRHVGPRLVGGAQESVPRLAVRLRERPARLGADGAQPLRFDDDDRGGGGGRRHRRRR
mmetsp:Transcript_25402/g.74778  ORF Transcript_25402/g.74778 Transcript_25402/m.74778 type:complete len:207 (-) Transcript_25402:324-944(-)